MSRTMSLLMVNRRTSPYSRWQVITFAPILDMQTFYFGGVTGQASRCFRTSFAWPVAVPASS